MNSLNDKDILNVLLAGHKLAATGYSTLVLESANPTLRNDVTGILEKTFKKQKDIFDVMSEKGWYPVQSASVTELSNAKQAVSSIQG
ncbi:MAG: spore coat protein [Clostridiales bacterium]|nr:spore coat protein [Clostridiales bacterium]